MASDLSARPSSRGPNELSRAAYRPPGSPPRVRFVSFLAASLVALASLLPAAALAADGLTITTPYPSVAVGPGSDVDFDLSVTSSTPGRVDLQVTGVPEGWTATLRGGGFVVDGVQANPEESAEVTLQVEVPAEATGTNEIVVRASGGGQTTDLPLRLRVEEQAAGEVTLATDFPSLRGASDSTFSFDLDLSNDTPVDLTFTVDATAPEGWQATAQIQGEERAASAPVEAGGEVGIDVEVTAPENAGAGTYPVTVTATSGEQTATAELQVEITGSYAMTLTTPDQRLNTRGTAGGEIRQDLVIQNTGTAPLEGVTISADAPTGWDVRYDPEQVPPVEPQNSQQVTAIITPSGDAIAGDYNVRLTASNENARSEQTIRVTVETSLLWGLIGVALIVAVLGGLWFVFRRYGRR